LTNQAQFHNSCGGFRFVPLSRAKKQLSSPLVRE
jgi:hypothetical protein